MKYSLSTILLALALMTMTLGVMGLGSSDPRELQSLSNVDLAAVPSIKINGVSKLLQILNAATAYNNSTFDIIAIDSFSQVTTDQGVAIQGKVTLSNDQNESVEGLITGVWDAITNKIVLNAQYEEETGESDDSDSEGETTTDSSNSTVDEDGYTPLVVNPAEVDTPVSAAFNWGVKALIETGEKQNKIPTSDYSVTEWTSAAYKNLADGVSYKFVAELLGANYVHVETNVTVVYKVSDQSYNLNGYYYRATNISEGSLPNNSTDVDNNNSTNSTDINNNSTDVNNNSTDANNSTDVNNNSTDINNGTNSTNNTLTTPPAVPENYTYISPDELANDSVAQAALSWGVDTLIQKAISQYKLPAASPAYNVTNLILAAYKNTSSGTNYIYQMNLTNALKYKVDTNITVAYRASNQTFKMSGYVFRSYNYPSGAIVIPPNNTNNATNITNNATNSTGGSSNSTNNSTGNVTVPDNSTDVNNSTGNATQPGNNSTTNSTGNTTQPNNGTNSTNPTNNTSPVNNTSPSNQTTADGYTIMNSTQLANDSIAQVALQNGTKTLIQTGVNQNKIPAANANYTINNVTFAGYKKGNIGTSYKFSVNMTNVDYVHVDANITVFYRYSTHVYSLNGWSFRSSNYTNNPLNNGTTIPPDMDPPIYDDASGDGIPIIIEPDGSSGAR